MKHSKRLLLSWILALVALMLVSNEALAEHWQWKQLSAPDGVGPTPPARALGTAIYDPTGNAPLPVGSSSLEDRWVAS